MSIAGIINPDVRGVEAIDARSRCSATLLKKDKLKNFSIQVVLVV